MPLHIFLVDDHQILIEGLRLLIDRQEGIQVVGTAYNCDVAWTLITELRPEIVLMDLEIPSEGGLALTSRIISAIPATKIIVLTGRADATTIHAAMAAGACGFVLKADVSSEIIVAIRTVAAGSVFISPKAAAVIAGDVLGQFETSTRLRLLAPHERDIVRRIAEGQSTKEIAFALQVSPKTIETRRARIMTKLAVTSVAGLTRFAVREGLVKL